MPRRLSVALRARQDRAFDRRAGIDTYFDIAADRLSFVTDAGVDAGDYSPTAFADFRRLIRHADVVPATTTFIDLGCGAGRVLVMAAMAGFGRVIGVEGDPGLSAIARSNVARWRKGQPGRVPAAIVEQDARDYDWPAESLLAYLYNPFGGPTFDAVLARLVERAGQGGGVTIAYNGNELADRIDATGRFDRRDVRPMAWWRRPTMSLHRSRA